MLQFLHLSLSVPLTKAQAMESMELLNKTKDEMAAQKLCLVLLKDRLIAVENNFGHNDWVRIESDISKLAADLKDEFEGLLKLRHHMDCKLKEICFDEKMTEANNKMFHLIDDYGSLEKMCQGKKIFF